MIDIKNITKSFGSLQVLKGIDLHIDRGEVVSIVGPSGAGKTTLLQIIGTLDRPDTGTVCVDGIDVTRLSQKKLSDFRNQHLGFVFQFHQLLPEFTAIENIMIPAYIAGTSTKAARQRAEELLNFMGLSDRATHKPNELSGGEKQRVAVARALVNNPAVILADEPSGSLDSKNKAELHQLLPEFTAIENIMIPAYIAGMSQKQAKQRAKELLDFMGLADRATHKPNELSGGEKQRVAVARALVNNPAVILADEPSGSLDTKNKEELHQLFFDLRDKFGQTFVIVTHDEQLASITDRTIHLRDGVIETPEIPQEPCLDSETTTSSE